MQYPTPVGDLSQSWYMQSITSSRNEDCGFILRLFATSWKAICTSWRTCSQTLLVVSTTSSRAVCERWCLSFSFIKRPAATSLKMKWGFSGTVCWESEPGWLSSNVGSLGLIWSVQDFQVDSLPLILSEVHHLHHLDLEMALYSDTRWSELSNVPIPWICLLERPRTPTHPTTRRKRSWEWAARTTCEVIETDVACFALPYIRRIGCHRLIVLQLAPAIHVTWSCDVSGVFMPHVHVTT